MTCGGLEGGGGPALAIRAGNDIGSSPMISPIDPTLFYVCSILFIIVAF